MDKQQKMSKVAICEKCQGFVLACDTRFLSKETEKEFTEFTNEGFTVKIETQEETRARKFTWWEDCKNGKCKSKNQK